MTSGLLSPPPSSLVHDDGSPRTGAYAGALKNVDIARLKAVEARAPLWRMTHEKRWLYVLITSEQYIAGVAVVQLGYASTAFAFIVDRRLRSRLIDLSCMTAPQLASVRTHDEHTSALFRGPRMRVSVQRAGSDSPYFVAVHSRRLDLHAICETSQTPTPLTVVSPVPEGVVNVTEKRVLLPTRGGFTVDGTTRVLHQALSGTDYTHGYLARETRWRWAMAMGLADDGTAVAFNLADGFNGSLECALWTGNQMFAVDSTRFTFQHSAPMQPWRVRTPNNLVDLEFRADAMHSEEKNLGLIRSTFVQPAGQFRGTLRDRDGNVYRVNELPGVVENQHSVW